MDVPQLALGHRQQRRRQPLRELLRLRHRESLFHLDGCLRQRAEGVGHLHLARRQRQHHDLLQPALQRHARHQELLEVHRGGRELLPRIPPHRRPSLHGSPGLYPPEQQTRRFLSGRPHTLQRLDGRPLLPARQLRHHQRRDQQPQRGPHGQLLPHVGQAPVAGQRRLLDAVDQQQQRGHDGLGIPQQPRRLHHFRQAICRGRQALWRREPHTFARHHRRRQLQLRRALPLRREPSLQRLVGVRLRQPLGYVLECGCGMESPQGTLHARRHVAEPLQVPRHLRPHRQPELLALSGQSHLQVLRQYHLRQYLGCLPHGNA